MADLCIGTAQWGSDYGVTNTGGQLSDEAVSSIMATALAHGVHLVDTAMMYGNAQLRLRPWASQLSISTKVAGGRSDTILRSIHQSLNELDQTRLRSVLVRDWETTPRRTQVSIAQSLEEARKSGLVERVGVSVYEAGAIDEAKSSFDQAGVELGIIQVPASAIDRRLDESESVASVASNGVRIQVRSVFLQGLLATPMQSGLGLHPAILRFHQWARFRQKSPVELALRHVLALPWANEVVVGVTSQTELRDVLSFWVQGGSTLAPRDLASTDLDLIDPRRW